MEDLSNKQVLLQIEYVKERGYIVEIRRFTSLNKTTHGHIFNVAIDVRNLGEFKGTSTNSKGEALKFATQKMMQHLDSLHPGKAGAKFESVQLTDNFNQDDNTNFCQVPDALSDTSRHSSKAPSEHVLSPIAFKPSVPHSELIFSHPSKKDFERMDIVNRFISAYTRGTSPLDIMNILIKMYPTAFTFKTKVKETPDKKHKFYIMDIIVHRLFSCHAGSEIEAEARNKVLLQAYSTLKKFAQLFAHFKLSYSADKSPLEIVDELVDQNGEMIRLQIKKTTICYHASVAIKFGTEFYASETGEEETKLAASTKAVNFLALLSDRVTKEGLQRLHNDRTSGTLSHSTPSRHDGPSSTDVFLEPPSTGSDKKNSFSSPLLDFSNDSLKQPVPPATTAVNQSRRLSQISDSTFNSNLLGNASNCTSSVNKADNIEETSPAKTGVLVDLSSSANIAPVSPYISQLKTMPFIAESTSEKSAARLLPLTKQIYLLNRFNSVYSVTKTVRDTITELKGSVLDDGAINVTTNTELMSDGSYLTTVKIEDIGAEFSEWAFKDQDSVEKALAKAVDFLKNLAKLVGDSKMFNTLQEHPSIVIEKLRAQHPQLVTVNTSKNRGIGKPQLQYLTVIRLAYLCSFAQTGASESASKQAASADAVAYLRKLAEGVYENYKPDLPPLTINVGQFPF